MGIILNPRGIITAYISERIFTTGVHILWFNPRVWKADPKAW